MTQAQPDTEELLRRTAGGDRAARGAILQRHRHRLRAMVAVRMDPRLAARIDPSDVVQEALAEADRRLDAYLRERPVAFYPWLRQLACDRLAEQHRRHVRAGRRSVAREEAGPGGLPDGSALQLADRLLGHTTSPSAALQREELRGQVRAALAALPEPEREVLVLRYLEQLSAAEVGAVLGVSEAAAKKRALRALQRLRALLKDDLTGGGRR
jgi:RNA polymerase sigma-70 factor (ECF subfamily)